jgi:hypothetical protein
MKIQEKILELRKELREEYDRISKNLYNAMLETDQFLERLSKGFDGIKEKEINKN